MNTSMESLDRVERKVSFFKWKTEYELGIRIIDEQHIKLVEYISDLYAITLETDKTQKTKEVIDRLFEYTEQHFVFEENILKDAQYPDFNAHQLTHKKFINQLIEYRQKFNEGKIVPAQLVVFLKDWLIQHIQGTDRLYIPFVKKIGL
jgi:hemerythrin-like metal-binding protein